MDEQNDREAFHLRVRGSMRRYFGAGLLAVLPLVISIWIVGWLIDVLESSVEKILGPLSPESILPIYIPGLGALLAVGMITLLGFVVSNVVIERLSKLLNRILLRIPVFRGVYSAVKRLVESVMLQGQPEFRRVVLVEYPRKNVYAVGLMTGVSEGETQEKTPGKLLNVFVPTTPNPTSGYYVLIPEDEVIPLEMSVEEAFKLVMSGGIVTPDSDKD